MRKAAWILGFLAGCAGYGGAYQAAERIAEARCERAFTCEGVYPEDAQRTHEERFGADEDACVVRLGPDPARRDVWDSAEDGGTVTLSKEQAKACASAIGASDCGPFWSDAAPEACDDAYVGSLPLDAACRIDAVCASGLCQDGLCAGNPE